MSEPDPAQPGPSGLLTFSSPKKKRTKKIPFHTMDKEVVLNVFKHLEESYPQDTYPCKKSLMDKTAEITGTSVRSVYRIVREKKQTGHVESPPKPAKRHAIMDDLDDIELGAIRRIVHTFYFNNELPTIDKVLNVVNADESLPDFKRTTFYHVLKKLQFKYVKRNRKSLLIDRDDIALWRVKYLNTMLQIRAENKKCYYTDETWLNEG